MAKGLHRALCLTAGGATILLSACGGHTAAGSSPGTSAVATAAPVSTPSTASATITAEAPRWRGTSSERVDAWFVDGGHAELDRLTAAIVGVGHAPDTFAALGAACAKVAAAVASAQGGSPIPDAVAQASFASALAEYGKSAADCQAGASSHDVALMNKAATATRAGTEDVERLDAETRDAQSEEVQREDARRCDQLYRAWKDGPASAGLSQFRTALTALQVAGAGNNLPAITAAAKNAGQPAALLSRYPVPACADPTGYFAAILARVRATAADAGTAKSLSAAVQALAPLKGVPALEAEFTAEVKGTAKA